MQVQPYLMFDGRCEEALDFYAQALGAQTMVLMRLRDSPEPPSGECASAAPPGDKVMHAEFHIGETALMASDGDAGGRPVFQGISLALSSPSEAEARARFDALADGGAGVMPLAKTFFSPAFGMVNDRFGVSWMVVTDAG
ncbi:VOC family protein [Acidovorax sp. MR-S7]|uniref:VOC family protein n=1 Tax=Acidovorax sp. MR-S7 TaxID=1268622 RepID=UPI00037ACBFC|nr:VOC family protein [Acidovorax sp. MR-S7]GAD23292.1 hypothetical protein AVS7_03052 [Acidovorax sp. MR-S7]